jgi:23S rRNA (uridine2552-2'-O)-methyltransferase
LLLDEYLNPSGNKKKKFAKFKKNNMKKTNTLYSKKKRSTSSKKWLLRQLNDPFVHQAKQLGYRSRAAFKLLEIEKKYKIFKTNQKILDLGAAPGGWSQIAIEKASGKSTVIGIDLLSIAPIKEAIFIQGDIEDEYYIDLLIHQGPFDIVMSDMAPNSCGIQSVDHIRSMNLIEAAYELARKVLKKEGVFIAKVLKGGTQENILKQLKKEFCEVNHFKPQSSRQESCEFYVVAKGFLS